MRRLIITILSVLVITGLGLGPARAQEPIRIVSEEVENHFPEELLFHIEVAGEAEISRITLRYHLRGGDVDTIVPLEFEPARRVQASHRWYTASWVIPPFVPILYRWEIEDATGYALETEERTFSYDDVRFDWRTLANDEVAVFWYEGDDDFGQELFDSASISLRELEEGLGAHIDLSIRVVVYGNRTDFRSAFPPMEEWVGGQAFSELALTVQIIPPGDIDDLGQTVPHEICHLLFYQLTDNPYVIPPAWLNEGLAVRSERWDKFFYDLLVADAASRGELLPIAFIVGSFPANREQALLAYAQSYSLVKTLIVDYGWTQLGEYLQTFKTARSDFDEEEAFAEVYGLPFMEFVNKWRVSLGAEPEAVPTPFPTMVPFGPRTAVPTIAATASPGPPPTAAPTTALVPTTTTTPTPQPGAQPAEGPTLPAWFYPILVSGIGLALALLLAVLFVLMRRKR